MGWVLPNLTSTSSFPFLFYSFFNLRSIRVTELWRGLRDLLTQWFHFAEAKTGAEVQWLAQGDTEPSCTENPLYVTLPWLAKAALQSFAKQHLPLPVHPPGRFPQWSNELSRALQFHDYFLIKRAEATERRASGHTTQAQIFILPLTQQVFLGKLLTSPLVSRSVEGNGDNGSP